MSFNGVKAVLLDIDNTLLDFSKCSYLAMQKSFVEHGLPFSQKVYTTFTEVNEVLWKRIEKGDYTRDLLHKERWNKIFGMLGINYDGEKVEQSFLDNLYDCVVVIDGAKEIVEYLASKYPVYTASNAPNDQQYNRLKVSGLYPYITKVFTSEALGVDKPQKLFFDKCFAQMNGVLPENTVMIGDSLSADIKGAKQYGLKTIWYNHLALPIPQEKFFDAKVDKLIDIKEIL